MRYEWTMTLEQELASGRRPDLCLSRMGAVFTVEVTRLDADRDRRDYDSWCDRLRAAMWTVELQLDVTVAGETDASALDDLDIEAFTSRVRDVAADVSRQKAERHVDGPGIRVTVWPGRLTGPLTAFSYPLLAGDMWTRLGRRMVEKAEQTKGGPPAWIRVDDQGGIFLLTDWAQADGHQQLQRLQRNVQATLCGFSHVRGVILSAGVGIGVASPEVSFGAPNEHDLRLGDPVSLQRRLPAGRHRHTFVVPVDGTRVVLRDHMELEPAYWYAHEASWLNWGLHELGQPPLAMLLRREP